MPTENSFTVNIKTGPRTWPTVTRNGSDYTVVPHETKYEIELVNDRPVQCDADVDVDGKSVGGFRIPAYSRMVLQRPVHVDQAFVFVKEKTEAAAQGGVQTGASKNGLITVTFTPDTYRVPARKGPSRGARCPSEMSLGVDDRCFGFGGMGGNHSRGRETLESCSRSMSRGGGDPEARQDRDYTPEKKQQLYLPEAAKEAPIARGATVLGAKTDQTFTDCPPLTQPDESNKTVINVRLAVQEAYSPLTAAPPFANPVPAPLPVT